MTVANIITVSLCSLIALVFVCFLVSKYIERRKPLEDRAQIVRKELLAAESKTGGSELRSGYYWGISDEMLREIAATEGFQFVKKVHRTLSFQRHISRQE